MQIQRHVHQLENFGPISNSDLRLLHKTNLKYRLSALKPSLSIPTMSTTESLSAKACPASEKQYRRDERIGRTMRSRFGRASNQ